MKRILPTAMLGLFLVACALCSHASANALQTDQVMHDPLFGITYLPSKVKFEPAPADIFRCRDLRDPRSILWLFGKVVKGKATFYYVYGLLEVDFGAGPTGEFETANDEGTIVVVSKSGCRDIGAGYVLSPDQKERQVALELGITDDVVSAILSDVVDREVKAFGGVAKFLAKVKATGIPESNLDPQVRAQLQALRNRAKGDGKQKTKDTGR